MPVHKVDGGYRWGEHGKLYKGKNARALAIRQGIAIKAAMLRRKKGMK